MIKQNFILAQNEKVVPIVSTMLEALEFTQTACVSNVFEYSQGQYHLNSWVEICKRPISFWCTYDSLLIVLDEEKEIEELPLPLRVLIAYGEIFKQPIKIIQSDGRLFKRKKKRLYWEDSDVQSYIKDAKIRRQAFTQNMKCDVGHEKWTSRIG